MYSSVRSLLTELIDYAGLFPPASLNFETALGNYERYRKGEFGWMLGRFILPASRLAELQNAPVAVSLPLSVLTGEDLDRDLKYISDFQRYQPASIQAIEVKRATVEKIREASEKIPSEIPAFFEVPAALGSAMLVPAIAEEAGCAKIRTGGVTADAFPASSDVVRFLQLCAVYRVPFKATAGLHHPLRGSYALTYEERSPCAVMHGFINIFLAAGFIRNHMAPELAGELLEEQSGEAFAFSDQGVRWRDQWLTSDEIAATRSQFAVSFGSCSVEEPIDDLKKMGLL